MNQLLSITDSLGLPVNVRSFGARGDARKANGDTLTGQTIICPDGNFTASDVGKTIWGATTGSGVVLPRTTVEDVVDATTIIVATAPVYACAGVTFVLGTDDTDAIRAAVDEVESRTCRGSIYIPSGGYITTDAPFVFTADPVNGALPSIVGEGSSSTVFYPAPDSGLANSNYLFNYDTLPGRKDMRGFSLDGTNCPHSSRTVLFLSSSGNYNTLTDVRMVNFSGLFAGVHVSGHATFTRCHIEGMWGGRGIYCNGSVVLVDSYVGNCGYFALDVTNGGLTVTRGVLDEAAAGTIKLQNAHAKLSQCLVYAGAGYTAVTVDGTSVFRASDCTIVPFNQNNNATGVKVEAGGTACLSQCDLKGSGTGHGLDNAGTVYDGGNNTANTKTGTGTITTLTL